MEAFFKYANSFGGVYGRKVSLYYQDDQYNPAITAKVVKQLVQKYNIFAIVNGFGTSTHQSVEPYLNQKQIPDLFVGSGCDCWNLPNTYPYTFGLTPSYTTQGRIIGKVINKKFPRAKVGVIYQDDDFGAGGLLGLRQALGPEPIVATQSYDPSSLSSGLDGQIQALKAAGVNLIVSFSIPEATALELIAESGLGMKVATFTPAMSADPQSVANLIDTLSSGKISGSAAVEGVYSLTFLPTLASPNDPWIKLFTKVHAEYDSALPLDDNTIYGMSVAYLTLETLMHSGRNPTRQGVVAWLNKPGSALMGPGLVPLSYSPTSHQGYSGAQLTEVQNSTSTPQGPIYIINSRGRLTVTHSHELPPPKYFLK
jgi:ABC-type branched-subunit amino acid transport system substrate-binding protein